MPNLFGISISHYYHQIYFIYLQKHHFVKVCSILIYTSTYLLCRLHIQLNSLKSTTMIQITYFIFRLVNYVLFFLVLSTYFIISYGLEYLNCWDYCQNEFWLASYGQCTLRYYCYQILQYHQVIIIHYTIRLKFKQLISDYKLFIDHSYIYISQFNLSVLIGQLVY